MTEAQLAQVLVVHRRTGQRLGRVAVELGFILEEDLLKALSVQLSVPYVRIDPSTVDGDVVRMVPVGISRRYHLVPLKKGQKDRLMVAMADPLNERAIHELELITGCTMDVVVSLESDIQSCLDSVFGSRRPDLERSADAFHKKIGEFLLEGGFIDQEQLDAALQQQQANGSRLGRMLVDMGAISEEDWMQALGMQLGLPFVQLDSYGLHPEVVRTIPEELARHYGLIPIAKQLNVLVTAMADPQDELTQMVIEEKTGYRIRPVISSMAAIEGALNKIYGGPPKTPPKQIAPSKRIGELLVEGGFITARQLQVALERQSRSTAEVPSAEDYAESYFNTLKAVMDLVPRDRIEAVVSILLKSYLQDRHIFIMGNGGSASNAAHFACDLSKTSIAEGGHRMRAMSLTENLPLLTAWANDTHYYFGFVEQLKNLMNSGDVVIGISGSGNSQNVLNGIAYANSVGGETIGLIGFSGGKLKDLAQESLIVPSDNMQRVEDVHLILVHLISSYLRRRIDSLKSMPKSMSKNMPKNVKMRPKKRQR
jgi:D-sedoheptulose 7-phosphate isomerase